MIQNNGLQNIADQYLFGDSDIAAQRLRVVAEVFAETSRSFVLDAVIAKPETVVDLGCGPGYTTRLLAEALGCNRTIGFDKSDHFISLAKKTAHDSISFLVHDVTSVPFPVGPSDLLYCRFLLSHLKNPKTLLTRWETQLKPHGLILIDEVESIQTNNLTFAAYLEIVAAMLANQSAELYVGPIVNRFTNTANLEKRVSQVSRLRVSNRQAAKMFYLNMQSWKSQPFVRGASSPSVISGLEQKLSAMINSGGGAEIEWGLRQIVFQRR
ncbi:MAG: class I SAM-dependent methyltransferase [Candidatus Lindowbacteria bacterium]|nr:class I SAM-dependent methyltransferase [Candidatus Lindowbacteria bacterium]